MAYTAALDCFMLVFVRSHHNQLEFRSAILEFVQPEEDNYLENHVIKSLMVDNKDQCEVRCYAENFCSSFNFGISETRGKLKFSSKKFLIAGQKTFLHDNFSYAAVDGNKSLSCEPEFHDSCPKHSTIQLFLFRTFNNSLFIMMDNLLKEKYLNSPLACLA